MSVVVSVPKCPTVTLVPNSPTVAEIPKCPVLTVVPERLTAVWHYLPDIVESGSELSQNKKAANVEPSGILYPKTKMKAL